MARRSGTEASPRQIYALRDSLRPRFVTLMEGMSCLGTNPHGLDRSAGPTKIDPGSRLA